MSFLSTDFRRESSASLRLALPLMAAQIAGVGMGTVDTILAGRLGPAALAAISVGANYSVAFFVFFMGLMMACSPIVAQRTGAGEADSRLGYFVRESLLLSLLLGSLWCAGIKLSAGALVELLALSPQTAALAYDYLQAMAWSGYGFSAWFVLRYAAEGLGRTRPIFLSSAVGLVANALFGWLLMHGHAGLPELGAPGLGWATTIASLLMAGSLALQYLRPTLRPVQLFASGGLRLGAGAREILRLGVPIGLILLAEAGLFVMAAMLMARFGEATIAAFQIAINFAALLFMIPLGLGLATTVRVGQAVGARLGPEIRYRGRVGMQLALLNAVSNALIMLLLARVIVGLYTQDEQIAGIAVSFLWLGAAFQFFDATQVTANGALRGIKDTRVPMAVTIVAYWGVGFPVAWWLAFHQGFGAAGVWWGLTVGLAVAALGLSLRFFSKVRRLPEYKNSVLMP